MNLALEYARDLIKYYEGFESKPYQDVASHWTVGYGFTMIGDQKVSETFPSSITEAKAGDLLDKLLLDLKHEVLTHVRSEEWITSARLGALLSFTYNVGIGNLIQSGITDLLRSNLAHVAASKITNYVWAGNRVYQGLADRRLAEKHLFEYEEFQLYHRGKKIDTPSEDDHFSPVHSPKDAPRIKKGNSL